MSKSPFPPEVQLALFFGVLGLMLVGLAAQGVDVSLAQKTLEGLGQGVLIALTVGGLVSAVLFAKWINDSFGGSGGMQ